MKQAEKRHFADLSIVCALLNIKEENKKIIISIPEKEKISLEERFKNYKGSNLTKEFSWDKSVGKEVWN